MMMVQIFTSQEPTSLLIRNCPVLVRRQRLWPQNRVRITEGLGLVVVTQGTKMRPNPSKMPAKAVVKDIRGATGQHFSTEDSVGDG